MLCIQRLGDLETGVTAYDGHTGWKIEPWQGKKDPEALSEEELRDVENSLAEAEAAYRSVLGIDPQDALALAAMELIGRNIRVAYAEPNNAAAREAMMIGATQAGLAFSNASVALVHGMARPIGAPPAFAPSAPSTPSSTNAVAGTA